MTGPIRVIIVDDHQIVRKGTSALLAIKTDIEVVGEACNGKEAVDLAARLQPDVILMDMLMPEMDGVEAIRQIKARQPGVCILVLTSFAADDKVFPAIKAGAEGYLLKDSSPQELVDAIHQVYDGESSLHPTIARKVLHELLHGPNPVMGTDPLTAREMDVLKHVARGLSNSEIADILFISEATVRNHVSNILGKLHLSSRVQATLYALRYGLVPLEEGEAPLT